MYTISKRYRFEASHRLITPYVGKCTSLHGHSFRVTLSLSSEKLNDCHMVEDFSALAPVGDWLKANLDHATLVAADDHVLLKWLKSNGQKHFVLHGNPTSEVLSKVIFDQARALGFSLNRVVVSETCTASAAYARAAKR